MFIKIVSRYLNKIKHKLSLDYLAIQEKLVYIFKEPDFTTAYLNVIASLYYTRDKSISDWMHRAKLVLKTYPDVAHAFWKRILITSFLLVLYDRQLASSLAVVKI